MLKVYITNIKWDTDGEEVDLPHEHELCCEGAIADELSDLYGWCVESFAIEIVSEPKEKP